MNADANTQIFLITVFHSDLARNLKCKVMKFAVWLTHCFFLVWEMSCLCWFTIFFISSISSSLHFSFTCLHLRSISACVFATDLLTACLFSSSISTLSCTQTQNHYSITAFPQIYRIQTHKMKIILNNSVNNLVNKSLQHWINETLSRASFSTRSVSRLFSAFIISLTSLKILVYLSWHMFWQLPSLSVCVARCSMRGAGEEDDDGDFLVCVDTDMRSGWWEAAVGISWLELTASTSGSGSCWRPVMRVVMFTWAHTHTKKKIKINKW